MSGLGFLRGLDRRNVFRRNRQRWVEEQKLVASDAAAADVDPSSLTLAGAVPRTKGRSWRIGSFADIDGDGDFDLLVHFSIADLDLTDQDTEAVLLVHHHT
jgi:hypothetical protein